MLVVRVIILQVKLGLSFDIDSVFSAWSAEDSKTLRIEAFASDIDEVSPWTFNKWDLELHSFIGLRTVPILCAQLGR